MRPYSKLFLKKLKKYGQLNDIPNITEEIGVFLYKLVKTVNIQNILEIGSANGYSTIWMAEALTNQGKITTIDCSTPIIREARQNFAQLELDNKIELIEGSALDILPQINDQFDLIFVDAQKSLYAEFWQLLKNKISGIVIFDNMKKFPLKTQIFRNLLKTQNEYSYFDMKLKNNDSVIIIF